MFYDVLNHKGKLHKHSYVYVSDEETHSWCPAVVAYERYIKQRKSEIKKQFGIDLKVNVLFQDGGPHDTWCSPFIRHATRIAQSVGIAIAGGKSPAGHGKYIHDQIGGGTKTKAKYGL